ncbi:MAG: glycosyl hydrolase-related protein [Firmicutes bacterium]|nr:glycosyl hydrolase-related protein [Bacillota bacterium]
MNLGRQWSDRLRIWAEQFPKFYYRMADALPVSYFTTMEHLTYAQALQHSYTPIQPGAQWGQKWEYGWFRTSLTVPEALAGKRLVFTLQTAEEMLVWVNGSEAGSIDKMHKYITLSRQAVAGDVYEIVAECYAGHGVRNEGAGPVAWGACPVPEPPACQVCVGRSSYGEWNEPLFQAAMDYLALYTLVQALPDKSLRAMKIVEGLKQFTYIADFELPEPAMTQSVVKADQLLKPLMECKNGSTAPEFTVFGQSHIDLAWLWPVEETIRKSARTYSNQLALMDEYDDYHFLLCEPPLLEWLKTDYPNVFARVREKTAQGRFYPEGGMWVESDTNLPSGESLIRQFAYGKRWFRKELGTEVYMAWMPDTFGFSAALPQIMKKCQIRYFATQKLTRQDPEADPFPYNIFWWEGMDGSRILSHSFKKSNAVLTPGDLVSRWENDRVQSEKIDTFLFPYGFGDGGGGPIREMVEMQRRCADLEGAPRCRVENPVRFFERQTDVKNVYCGELYLAWHRGTLTSQARTKRGIRKAEICLKQVEYAMSLLRISGREIPAEDQAELERLWKLLLFNQFHDVAPGTAIARVYERAERELSEVVEKGEALIHKMLGQPSAHGMLYNPLSWPRTYHGVHLPAQGCAPAVVDAETSGASVRQYGGMYELRNAHLICRIDSQGQLCSMKIPGSDREYMAGEGNRFLMYKDVNVAYDAWEIGSMYENLPVPLTEPARLEPFRDDTGAGLIVERMLHDSRLTQKILLGHDACRLDFITSLDFREKHKLLKVAFPANIYTKEAIHEIQFGYVKRPTHRSRQAQKDQYEVCNHRYSALSDGAAGLALLNDCKYGISVSDNEMRLTLLKSPMMPDAAADQGIQRFTYSVYPFTGAFQDSGTLRQAAELNEPPIFGAQMDLLSEPIFLPENPNIVVETIKPADTVGNALLVRAYEAMGMATSARFTVAKQIRGIAETDMLEEHPVTLPCDGALHLEFGAFEIKTLLLYL